MRLDIEQTFYFDIVIPVVVYRMEKVRVFGFLQSAVSSVVSLRIFHDRIVSHKGFSSSEKGAGYFRMANFNEVARSSASLGDHSALSPAPTKNLYV